VAAATLLGGAALGQTAPPEAGTANSPAPVQRVEVTGDRQNDTQQRRQSTAAKIIVGREEIEKYGDASLGEVLKRLPGVTMDGVAGRGGNIRMRGLGGGYTQILLDGERVQGGLSLDSIDPEQVERIEILRAPTAETGARAIAGTINIVMREGYRKRLNDLKLGVGTTNDHWGQNIAWTRDDKISDALNYNLSLSAYNFERGDRSQTDTTSPELDQHEVNDGLGRRQGVHASARLQWRLESGSTLMLMPMLIASQGDSNSLAACTGCVGPTGTTLYDQARTASDDAFSLARLNGQWRGNVAPGVRLEAQGGLGRATHRSQSHRRETGGLAERTLDDSTHSLEDTAQLRGKLSTVLEGDHSLVTGLEVEAAQRSDTRSTLQNGQPLLITSADAFDASSLRVAGYAQDEWALNPNWSAHAGLRWEGIETHGEGLSGEALQNRSSVWTPLLHAVWKPDPKGRDQIRMSLTRSYRSPSLASLVGQPVISSRYAAQGPDAVSNTATSPDRTGNPGLKPELATGIDIAYEHYLPGNGLLSANVFYRRINNLMRTVVGASPQTVSWSALPRWVAAPQNIGNATTQGIELEAKGKLSDIFREAWPEAPALELRANLSLFHSTVDSVPGPDNRLDQQARGTANLGADYKLPGWPLTLGGNVNLTPATATRLSASQWSTAGRKRVVDAYALWQISPTARLRLSGSNLAPEDALSVSTVADETARTRTETYLTWRLQLELKL
jgi:iron complex outermembrane receptor protein